MEPDKGAASTCDVCMGAMGTATRPRFECQFCAKPCCLDCAKRYVLSQAELQRPPSCMFPDCRREFSPDFVDATFPVTWRRTELRQAHQQQILTQLDQLLMVHQPVAATFKEVADVLRRVRTEDGYIDELEAAHAELIQRDAEAKQAASAVAREVTMSAKVLGIARGNAKLAPSRMMRTAYEC